VHHSSVFPPIQKELRVPDFPANEAKGSHVVSFSKTIFIEQSDFREVFLRSFHMRICFELNQYPIYAEVSIFAVLCLL